MKKRILMILLIMIWIIPMTYGELLTREEIDSIIPLDQSFTGFQVRLLVWSIVQEADKEIEKTAKEAVKEAVIPLLAERDLLKKQLKNTKTKYFFIGVGSTCVFSVILYVVIRGIL